MIAQYLKSNFYFLEDTPQTKKSVLTERRPMRLIMRTQILKQTILNLMLVQLNYLLHQQPKLLDIAKKERLSLRMTPRLIRIPRTRIQIRTLLGQMLMMIQSLEAEVIPSVNSPTLKGSQIHSTKS
jgi:hypothetical protein